MFARRHTSSHLELPSSLLPTVLVILLFAVSMANVLADQKSIDREQEAVSALRRFATNIQFHQDETVRLVRLSKSGVSDEHLSLLKSFHHLEYLAVVCPQVTDAGIAHLSELSHLDTLMLSESGITDSGLAIVERMSRLERLAVDKTSVGDVGLQRIGRVSTLKVLSLVRTQVSDAGLAHLAGLHELESLRLDGTRVTGQGLKHLRHLENLQFLYLDDCPIETDLAILKQWPKLKHVSLNGTGVTAEQLASIVQMESLQTLEVYRTGVSQEGLLHEVNPSLRVFGLASESRVASLVTTGVVEVEVPPEPILKPWHERLERGQEVPDLQRHVVPLLGRLGCNSRTCHGAFAGQGGFRLSMFGYDFLADHENLVERVDLESVETSLLLNKPTSADEHEGGERLPPGGWEQRLLRRWIEAGAQGIASDPPTFVRLDVSPAEVVATAPEDRRQLRVVAVWTDGTREDVTSLTRFETRDDAVAQVTPDGLVTVVGRGDTHVIAFYDNGIVPVPVVLPIGPLSEGVAEPRGKTQIDQLVVRKLNQLGIRPAEVADDAAFLRRVSLDLIGTLPTESEVRAFLADTTTDKRTRKIEELLLRPEYVAWWTNLLCDLTGSNAGYLGSTEMAQPVAAQWRSWIALRVRENIGWDEIARGIVTATSRRSDESYAAYVAKQSSYTRPKDDGFAALGNPMPHFWYRDNITLASDKALAFGYTFMGVRLDCAQCHKHPFNQWSKDDFEKFTQFFTRIKTGTAPDATDWHGSMRAMLGVPDKLNTAALRRQSYLRIAAEGRPIPWNEVYLAPPGKTPQTGKLLGAGELDLNAYQDPRKPLFEWLLHEPQHYFAKSFVNRVWAHYFHAGIINPPDDLNLANPPSNQRLIDFLTEAFIAHDYDMKWLHRTITSSETYQRSWKPNKTNRADERHFSRAVLRRLPAEVVVDAMIQATASDSTVKKLAADVQTRKIAQHPKSYQTRSIDYSLLVFGKPLRTTNCDCERQNDPTLVQALYRRNDQETLQLLDRQDGWLKQLEKLSDDELDVGKLVESAYLRVLSRYPTSEELVIGKAHVMKLESKTEGMRDLMWALLNTQEFITNH